MFRVGNERGENSALPLVNASSALVQYPALIDRRVVLVNTLAQSLESDPIWIVIRGFPLAPLHVPGQIHPLGFAFKAVPPSGVAYLLGRVLPW